MRPGALGRVGVLRRLWSRPERRLQLLVLCTALAVVAGVTAISLVKGDISEMDYWEALGYPGVFFLSFLGSVSMVLPVPGLLAVCGLSVGLNPFILGLLAGIGEAIGETSGYAIGYGGESFIERRGFYLRLRRWMERRGTLVLLVVSMIPNPIFDIVGIAAGAVRFPLRRFMITIWIGKTLKGWLVAYACYNNKEVVENLLTWLPWVD